MGTWRQLWTSNQNLRRHWGPLLGFFTIVWLLSDVLAILLFQGIGQVLMNQLGIHFISFALVTVVLKRPLVSLCMLFLLAGYLAIAYWTFVLLANGTRQILSNQWRGWRHCLDGRKHHQLGFFAVWLLASLPVCGFGFHFDLMDRIKLPVAAMTTLLAAHPALFLGLVLVYIGLLALAIWQFATATVRPFKETLRLLAAAGSEVVLLLGIGFGFVLVVQMGVDAFLTTAALPIAGIQFGLVLAIRWAAGLFANELFFSLLQPTAPVSSQPAPAKRHTWVIGLVCLVCFLAGSSVYFVQLHQNRPLTIAHRGVNGVDGVQNTLPALKNTVRKKPDFVEIDLHETKDQRAVVLHDDDLRKLADLDYRPEDLTLRQLEQITVHEQGRHAKLVSFANYLKTAQQHQQKLLVELKITPQTSAQFTRRFMRKYGRQLLQHGGQIHSESELAVVQVKREQAKLPVGLIGSFDGFGMPQTPADFLSQAYLTLNPLLMWQANRQHKQILAWTVDTPVAMDRVLFLGPAGIVTDRLDVLHQQIELFDGQDYAHQLAMEMRVLMGIVS
ncbi:glycerophosphodiester phosphodiesterase [Lactobacillus selangorensis]|uniref:Glycerophosphodiester phosphodiesterase n=1 Tax=Lactobacillus selangorensis TaxID=81857 RepID=A0A0R2FWQ1_9LACO|nr:glycerophosphodiester phosphodiesterase [Lactobacillus selangorensis]KRN28852.1 glycerophosphodiester phosphodiesterase [Lactobacillus selangorensis]KRN32738.1 glycerophosphodiester phosphodiesterase [Lactobacillus selangorensis]